MQQFDFSKNSKTYRVLKGASRLLNPAFSEYDFNSSLERTNSCEMIRKLVFTVFWAAVRVTVLLAAISLLGLGIFLLFTQAPTTEVLRALLIIISTTATFAAFGGIVFGFYKVNSWWKKQLYAVAMEDEEFRALFNRNALIDSHMHRGELYDIKVTAFAQWWVAFKKKTCRPVRLED